MLFDDLDDEDDLIDAPPPAPVQGLLPPRKAVECLGHGSVEAALLEMAEGGKLPHALIFSGPLGIGKATMAFRLARYMLDKSGEPALFPAGGLHVDPDGRTFKQVASGGHPDLLTIERLFDEKKGRLDPGIKIEEARRIAPFMRKTAGQGGWRVVIVDDADTMNRNAQNAILKILEEPPKNALLILVCHRLGAMIPTIRSRCRVIPFVPPERASFARLIEKDYGSLSTKDKDVLYAISGGSVGQAVQIAGEGGLEALEKIMGLLHGWPDWKWSQIHMLAESMGRQGQDDSLKAFENVFLWIIDSLLRAKACGQSPRAPLDNEAAQRLLAHFSLTDWIGIAERLREHFQVVTTGNLDKRHAVLGAFGVFG